jgi:hypothetical protein
LPTLDGQSVHVHMSMFMSHVHVAHVHAHDMRARGEGWCLTPERKNGKCQIPKHLKRGRRQL